MQPIHTDWSLDNETAKQSIITHIAAMSKRIVSVDHARQRAKEIAKEWPEFLDLLRKELTIENH